MTIARYLGTNEAELDIGLLVYAQAGENRIPAPDLVQARNLP